MQTTIITPKVGDGITWSIGSDSYAGTITGISPSGKTLYFTEDNYRLIDGNCQDGSAVYAFEPDTLSRGYMPYAMTARLTTRKGKPAWRYNGHTVGIGFRRKYIDPHF